MKENTTANDYYLNYRTNVVPKESWIISGETTLMNNIDGILKGGPRERTAQSRLLDNVMLSEIKDYNIMDFKNPS